MRGSAFSTCCLKQPFSSQPAILTLSQNKLGLMGPKCKSCTAIRPRRQDPDLAPCWNPEPAKASVLGLTARSLVQNSRSPVTASQRHGPPLKRLSHPCHRLMCVVDRNSPSPCSGGSSRIHSEPSILVGWLAGLFVWLIGPRVFIVSLRLPLFTSPSLVAPHPSQAPHPAQAPQGPSPGHRFNGSNAFNLMTFL